MSAKTICVTLIATSLAGCGQSSSPPKFANGKDEISNQVHAQILVEKRLRDPASAQFSRLSVADIGLKTVVCGEVNAKNGFGGYGGRESFVVMDERATLASDLPAGEFVALWKANCPPTLPN
jgi:hypothetical protein